MLKFYSVNYHTFINGEYMGVRTGRKLVEEGTLQNEHITVDWDNLITTYHKYAHLVNFEVYTRKKGYCILYCPNLFTKTIKQWKDEKLDIVIQIEYKDISSTMNIQDVLNWHDADKAIQYLNEKNLKI